MKANKKLATSTFWERHGQSLVKVGQIWSNLIDVPKATRLSEIHFQISIIRIEDCGDILVLVKFKTNWMFRLREHSHTRT